MDDKTRSEDKENRRILSLVILALLALLFGLHVAVGYFKFQEAFFPKRDPDTTKIFDFIMKTRKGKAFKWLAELCDDYGPRRVGSKNLEDAENFVMKSLAADGFNVHSEPVAGLPKWTRSQSDRATVLEPRLHKLNILAIPAQFGDASGAVEAEVAVVSSFDELEQTDVRGKIVVFNSNWTTRKGIYWSSADKAGKKGAVGLLVPSSTPYSLYTAHTGIGAFRAKIPAASVTVEEAAMIGRWAKRGKKVRININITSHLVPKETVTNRNIVFDLVGSELPNEIILFACHFDSWDVGQGAVDDAGGCAVAHEAILTLKLLGELNPKFRSKRTIRGIFFAGEELNYLGAAEYFRQHGNRNCLLVISSYRPSVVEALMRTDEKFVFVFESDMGAFKPLNWKSNLTVRANADALNKLQHIIKTVNDQGVPLSVVNSSRFQGDVDGFAGIGVAAANYQSDRFTNYYFNYHHSHADYVSAYEESDLDTVSAIVATLGHHLGQMASWTNF